MTKMLSDNQKSYIEVKATQWLQTSNSSTDTLANANGSSRKVKIKKWRNKLNRSPLHITDKLAHIRSVASVRSSMFSKWALLLLFIVSFSSTSSAQGWDRSRFARSGTSKRNSQLCDTSDENDTVLGASCDFEEGCQWSWIHPGVNQTGFRNVTSAQIIEKIHRLGEWAFRGPLMDTKNKTDGKSDILC